MKDHRDLTDSEMAQLMSILDKHMIEVIDAFVVPDPSCRRAISKCLLGSAIAICQSFGVDALYEAKLIRSECGIPDEIVPPDRN
jgi:hypothetical protein